LPEVEAMRRLAEEHCVSRKVARVLALEQGGGPRDGKFDDKVIGEGVTEKQMVAALTGRTVTAAKRRGKHLWLELDGNGPCLLLHFGMTGSLAVDGVERFSFQSFNVDESWPPRFTKLQLDMAGSGAAKLAFADPRRFGKILLRNRPEEEPPVSLLAADPIVAPPALSAFTEALEKSALPVKSLLLDQERIVCGVGNWMADEVLHEARVLPCAPGRTLSERQAMAVHAAVCSICQAAISVDADAAGFPKGWLFHYRWGHGPQGEQVQLPDGTCVSFTNVGGRTTAYVPSRQCSGERRLVHSEKAAGKASTKKPVQKRRARGKSSAEGTHQRLEKPALADSSLPKFKVKLRARKRPAAPVPRFKGKLRAGSGHSVLELD